MFCSFQSIGKNNAAELKMEVVSAPLFKFLQANNLKAHRIEISLTQLSQVPTHEVTGPLYFHLLVYSGWHQSP